MAGDPEMGHESISGLNTHNKATGCFSQVEAHLSESCGRMFKTEICKGLKLCHENYCGFFCLIPVWLFPLLPHTFLSQLLYYFFFYYYSSLFLLLHLTLLTQLEAPNHKIIK